MQSVTQLWREPLVHFLAIGVVLFTGSVLWRQDAGEGAGNKRIEVTAAEIKWLKDSFQARWQRPPAATELRGLVDSFVRQEVLYREALAVGLDRNDEIIRRRMVQKIEFMTEDLASQQPPTEAELTAYFKENLDQYRIPQRRRFNQIFFNIDQRGEAAQGAAKQLLDELRSSPGSPADPAESGDRLLLEYGDQALSQSEIERYFGQRFAAAVFEVQPGPWHGPIASGYGLHLVRVTEVDEGIVPELAAVRNEVLRDHSTTVRQRARQALYSSLAEQYDIEIDEEAIRTMSLAENLEVAAP